MDIVAARQHGSGAMGIELARGLVRNADGHRPGGAAGRDGDGAGRRRSAIALAGILLDDAGDGVALDALALPAGGLAEGGGGEAVEVAHGAGRGLVQERNPTRSGHSFSPTTLVVAADSAVRLPRLADLDVHKPLLDAARLRAL